MKIVYFDNIVVVEQPIIELKNVLVSRYLMSTSKNLEVINDSVITEHKIINDAILSSKDLFIKCVSSIRNKNDTIN